MAVTLKTRDGKSAYQTWLDAGNTGTEAAFLLSLKGATGAAGATGATGAAGSPGAPGAPGSNATAYTLPRYTGGTIGRLVKQVTVAGVPAWADIAIGDQDLDVIGYLASDNQVYGQGGHPPLAVGTPLVANTTYRLATPVSTGPNLTPLESVEPTPTNAFTLLVAGKVNGDKTRLNLVPLFLPLYVENTAITGELAEYQFVQGVNAAVVYDTQSATPGTYNFTPTPAPTWSTRGTTMTTATRFDPAIPMPSTVLTVAIAFRIVNYTQVHTILAKNGSGGPVIAVDTGGKLTFQLNTSTATRQSTISIPLNTNVAYVIEMTGTSVKVWNSAGTLVYTDTGFTVSYDGTGNIRLGRLFGNSNFFEGELITVRPFNKTLSGGELSSVLARMNARVASVPA